MDEALLTGLDPHERHAITLVKLALDLYNSQDGTGLFTGMERYQVLTERLGLAAQRTQRLVPFWGVLCQSLNWPIPPAAADDLILPQLCGYPPDLEQRVLATILRERISIVMLAREWHRRERAERKETRAA